MAVRPLSLRFALSSQICANRRNRWITGFGCGRRPPVSRWGGFVRNKPNSKRSFRFEVSRVKTGKEWSGLPTSHAAEGRLRMIPHYSSILSFHHSAPNKANFGPGRRKDKCCVDKEL
jgi:hypothetical protein